MDIILIHGAYHDATCWSKLIPHLQNHGHRVHALTMPGHADMKKSGFWIGPQEHGAMICGYARKISKPSVLLGHSLGGLSITAAGELMPELFSKIIYLTAVVPPPNVSMLHILKTDMKDTGVSANGFTMSIRKSIRGYIDVDRQKARTMFYNRCSQEDAIQAIGRLTQQPAGMALTKNHWTLTRLGTVEKHFIECLDDNAIQPSAQRLMQRHLEFKNIRSLDSDHSPFLSMPDALAASIVDILQD